MDWLTVIAGLLIVALVTVDVLWTTLTLDGSGKLSSVVTRWVTLVMTPLRRSARARVMQGPAVLFAQTAVWVLLSWVGWMLVFCSFDDAVLVAKTEAPATFWSRAYYVGFVMVTLGNGELMPGSHVWQFFSVASAAHGFILITLSVSYFVPVLDGVHTARVAALQIQDLGRPAGHAISLAYDGDGYARLASALGAIAERGVALDRRIRAHPVLLSFQTRPEASLPVSIAHLDDVLLLLENAVADAPQPSEFELAPVRRGLDRLVAQVAQIQDLDEDQPLAPPASDELEVPRAHALWDLSAEELSRRALLRSWLVKASELDEYENARAGRPAGTGTE